MHFCADTILASHASMVFPLSNNYRAPCFGGKGPLSEDRGRLRDYRNLQFEAANPPCLSAPDGSFGLSLVGA